MFNYRSWLSLSLLLSCLFTSVATAQSLSFAWPLNVGPLNPHLYSPNQMFAQGMVYEPLVAYQADGSVKPALATSWKITNHGKTYLFKLRHHVVFSNGEPFNADAVVSNFKAVMDNKVRHSWLELVNQIASFRALSSDTFELNLKHAYYPALQELSLPRPFRFIAPSQFVDGGTKHGIKKPIGTGPWVLSQTRLNQEDIFEVNPHYWGKKPALDKIIVKVISDPNSRAVALETGDVDLLYGVDSAVTADTFERFKTQGQFTTELSAPIETISIAMNSRLSPTQDVAVRRAINHAVNKKAMIQSVLYNTQQQADTLFAPTVPYANIHLKPYSYSLDKARAILDKAGWIHEAGQTIRHKGKTPLKIHLAYVGTNPINKSMAEIIQGQLRQVGIDVVLVGEEESSVQNRQRTGQFDMVFNRTWGAPYDPHAMVSSMRVPSHADFQAQRGLKDKPLIDKEIAQVLISTTQNQRQQLYRDIFTRLHQDAVYLPLTYVRLYVVANPKLGKIPFAAIPSQIPFSQIVPVSQ